MSITSTVPAPPGSPAAAGSDRYGLVGTIVADKYRIECVVGEGGFGVVYRARHQIWDEPIAVKCFTALADAPVALRQELLDQFVREGKLLTSLSGRTAAIVQAHDIGNLTTPTGHWLPYMVLEWLDGRALDAWLGPARRPACDPRTAYRLMDGPARALALAHTRGVAHRDIKPANFFVLGDELTPGAIIKVLDFGIAKVMQGSTVHALQATGAHLSSFTPAYGAPEQFDRSHGATGPWTDVFQMALVLVEIMRGGLPALDGEEFVHLAFASQNHTRRPTPRTHGLVTSDAVEAVFLRALAVKAADRFRDMNDFWTALAEAVDSVPAPRPTASSRPFEPPRTIAAAYHVVLEFSRARDAGRPNAFVFSPQSYLLHSPGGGTESAEFPWTPQLLEDLAAVRQADRATEAVHRIGETLRTFLAAVGWSYHERAILAAARDGAPIFMTIRSAAAELYALPWEFVALKATGQLLGSIPGLLLRYEWPDAPTFPDRFPPEHRRGRVLVAWSAAGGDIPAGKLVTALHAAFHKHHPEAFDPRRDILAHASPAKIDRALDEAARVGPPIDALHILCHGTAIGAGYGLALDDDLDPGTPVAVDAAHAQRLLAEHAAMLRLVVLAACDSGDVGNPGNHLGSIAQMIHRVGIQDVVASRFPLSTDGSLTFAEAFYNSLAGESSSLEQAFLAARDVLIRNPHQFDWASIQLYSRDSDGHATRPLRFRDHTTPRPAAPPPVVTPPPLHRTTVPATRGTGKRVSPLLGGVAAVVALSIGVMRFLAKQDTPLEAEQIELARSVKAGTVGLVLGQKMAISRKQTGWEKSARGAWRPDLSGISMGLAAAVRNDDKDDSRRIQQAMTHYERKLQSVLIAQASRCKDDAKIMLVGLDVGVDVVVAARFIAVDRPTLSFSTDSAKVTSSGKRQSLETCLAAVGEKVSATGIPSGKHIKFTLKIP